MKNMQCNEAITPLESEGSGIAVGRQGRRERMDEGRSVDGRETGTLISERKTKRLNTASYFQK